MNSSDSEEEALVLAALAQEEEDQRGNKLWVHDINLERQEKGEFCTLMPQLRTDEKRFFKYFRMSSECFDDILSFITEDIEKNYTNFREPISAEQRLAITLRFIATGDNFTTIGHSYRVGISTVAKIVKQVCAAICRRMEPIYLPEPTKEMWIESAEKFETLWQFPNCIGSLDGKHITIKCPKRTGSHHFCYLKKFSIVLMAIVGADYRFICVDIGGFGKNSDGGIFDNSNMGQRFEAGLMNVPDDKNLPGQNEPSPYVLVGDEAFALKSYLMRPFPYRQAKNDRHKEIYNNRLCRARRIVENAFGILAQKWRIFYRPVETKVETTILIVQTACILHNFLRTKANDQQGTKLLQPKENVEGAFIDIERDLRRATNIAFVTREKFVNYFNTNE